jgi:hypothetical protein
MGIKVLLKWVPKKHKTKRVGMRNVKKIFGFLLNLVAKVAYKKW